MPRMMAPAMMPKLMSLPTTSRAVRMSAPEQDQPRGKGHEADQRRVYEGARPDAGINLGQDKDLPYQQSEHQPCNDADQPCRKERAQDVDGGRQQRQPAPSHQPFLPYD